MNLDIYKNAGVYTKFSIDILSYICYMSAIGIALCLIAILICKIYKNIVCRIIPISTPCIDRNKKIDTGMIKQLILKNYLKDRKC